jgi:hypothetical protein
MEYRLSEDSARSVLDAGHTSVAWLQEDVSGVMAGYDLNKILESDDARAIVQSIPPQSLYFSLLKHGLEEAHEILPLLSTDQVIKIFDYDVWSQDHLDSKKALKWLALFGEVSTEELFKRFSNLDEEYQLAILDNKIQLFTEEELQEQTPELQDQVYPFPGSKVFYRILSEDTAEVAAIVRLIESCFAENLPYAYSLLQHVVNLVPHEEEAKMAQFRKARLEEDGFVTYEESQRLFDGIKLDVLLEKYRPERSVQNDSFALRRNTDYQKGRYPFLITVLMRSREVGWDIEDQYQVYQTLLYLVNGMGAACQVTPDDIHGLNRIMQLAQAGVSLGLEFLAGSDVDLGVEILKNEHAQLLFKVSITLVDLLRSRILEKLRLTGFAEAEKMQKWHQQRKWGLILSQLDRSFIELFGHQIVEMLKGLFNRFPLRPVFNSFDHENSEQKHQIHFEIVDSVSSFSKLAATVDTLAGMLYLLTEVAGSKLSGSLERLLATAVVNSAVKGTFSVQPVTGNMLATLSFMSEEEFTAFTDKLYEESYAKLTSSFADWSVGMGYTGVNESTQGVIALFKDIVLGISLARSIPSDLARLVITEA